MVLVAGFVQVGPTVEVYAKKPQIQERLTVEIAEALDAPFECSRGLGLGVWEAEHMCMNMAESGKACKHCNG